MISLGRRCYFQIFSAFLSMHVVFSCGVAVALQPEQRTLSGRVERISIGAERGAARADEGGLNVFAGEKTLLEGWTVYNTYTCATVDPGRYTATTQPKNGVLTYTRETRLMASGSCAGKPAVFAVAYYTWTKSKPENRHDVVGLHWQDTAGDYSDDSTFNINLGPQILMSGKDVTGTTNKIIAGEVLNLTVAMEGKTTSWTVSGTNNGGYTPTSSNPSNPKVLPVDTKKKDLKVYLLSSGKQKITFSTTTPSGKAASADVFFDVALPKPVKATARTRNVLVLGKDTISFGDPLNGKPGIQFNASGTGQPGSGSFYWVQVLTSDKTTIKKSDGKWYNCSYKPGLDNTYPYPGGVETNDSPAIRSSGLAMDVSTSFSMYLLWISSVSDSIPVPLGYFNWKVGWVADRNPADGLWRLKSQSKSASAFNASASYPLWSRIVKNGGVSCVATK